MHLKKMKRNNWWIEFLKLSYVSILLLILTPFLTKEETNPFFKRKDFPYGIRTIKLNDKVELFVTPDDYILADNFTKKKCVDSINVKNNIENFIEYAHSKDSLIIKYINPIGDVGFCILKEKDSELYFHELNNGEYLYNKTRLRKDSFQTSHNGILHENKELILLVIYFILFIHYVLFIVKYRHILKSVIFCCTLLLCLYLYIDYKGGLDGAHISLYHILYPQSVIEIDLTVSPPPINTSQLEKENIYFNSFGLEEHYILSFSFFQDGVIAQYFDNNLREIRYAHLKSVPDINERFTELKMEYLIDDVFATLVFGKKYYANITPIENNEAKNKLKHSHKTLWINLPELYSASILRNFSKLGLKILIVLYLLTIIKETYKYIKCCNRTHNTLVI